MPEEQRYSVTKTHDVHIPMRDGTHLAANLYRPDGAGPAPAIIVYMPYLKDVPWGYDRLQVHFAARGYACLTVDVRGFGGADGVAAPPNSLSEKQDGRDLNDWIAAQPWCNGTTGMWGISYSGSTSLSAASMRPPSLKAIVPMHGTADEYLGFLHPHGCRPAWWTENSWGPGQVARQLLPPLHRDPQRRWARIWRERLDHLEPWPFFWHTIPPETYMPWRSDLSAITAATYGVCAWHDYYPRATLDYFNAITAPKKVLIGPWKHEYPDLAINHPIDFIGEMDRWWDHWLKGIDNGVMDTPPGIVWQQGEDRWRYEDAWPPRRGEFQTLYAGTDGTLSAAQPAGEASDRYVVDPTVGLHLLPWDPQAPIVPMPYDRSDDDHRSQTYTGAPLAEALEIGGDPEAVIALSSDQPEFPLSVWLCDVAPNGHSTLICQGWVSAAFAAGEPLRPDRVYTIRVPLYSTSYRVPAGHRLRLGIAGANFPLLWPSPQNPTLQIQRSPAHATHVRIPVAPIPAGPLPGPTWGPSLLEPLPRTGSGRDDLIIRDLTGSIAEFHQTSDKTYTLDDGSTLRIRATNISTIAAARPGETTLKARVEAEVRRPVDAVTVTVDALQTRDRYAIDGRVEVDGKRFFARSWELDL